MADIREVVDGITGLPTLPDVVAKLNRMIGDPNTSAGDINEVISRDVSLSAKILKLVNSPYYGFPRRITTITYAVVILGFNTVRNLALSAFIFDAFKKGGQKEFDLAGFWRYSIGVAIAAQNVAKKTHLWQDEEAFMAGLLHGVGMVIMNQHLRDDLLRVVQHVRHDGSSFLEAERAELDYDHEQLGGLLLEKWNLPEKIVDGVRYCSAPLRAEKAPELACVLNFSAILARSLLLGFWGDERLPALEPGVWEKLKLSWQDVDSIMDAVAVEYSRAGAFFELI